MPIYLRRGGNEHSCKLFAALYMRCTCFFWTQKAAAVAALGHCGAPPPLVLFFNEMAERCAWYAAIHSVCHDYFFTFHRAHRRCGALFCPMLISLINGLRSPAFVSCARRLNLFYCCVGFRVAVMENITCAIAKSLIILIAMACATAVVWFSVLFHLLLSV